MIAGNGFEPLAGKPPERRAGFSHATARLRPGNRYASDNSSTGAPERWLAVLDMGPRRLGPRVAGSSLARGSLVHP
jgi:hypothetical protein